MGNPGQRPRFCEIDSRPIQRDACTLHPGLIIFYCVYFLESFPTKTNLSMCASDNPRGHCIVINGPTSGY